MYTRCPHCRSFFSVTAEQLGAADGRVRCGSCLSIFDGLEHLTERASPAAADGSDTRPEVGPSDRTANDEAKPERQAEPASLDADASNNGSPPMLGEGDTAAGEGVPEVIKEELARAELERGGRKRSAMLTVFALVLLMMLGMQYAWFKPEKVLGGYPQARPWLERFCAYTGCRLPDRRNPSKIQMLARDVRVHPGYEGALLVMATLVNSAAQAQPYPRLQFSVFNVNGQTIASRIFEPEEYLSADLDPKGNMPPGKPLQIAIELVAPKEAAISYEFRFL